MNIVFTIFIVIFFTLCTIGGVIEIFDLDKEEVDTQLFREKPIPEKRVSVTYTCVNCGAPIKSKYCEYCGTEYK